MSSCEHVFDLLRQCHKCGLGMVRDPEPKQEEMTGEPELEKVPNDREALQRILYEIVASYDQAHAPIKIEGRRGLFGPKTTTLGGDSELLRDAIRIGKIMLKENGWCPDERD